ncbi:hypothetical protein T484DRAFT_3645113 [Baffinella frigidus]|nr:hypothetical protein T484DRAFT_3645113 [Cryptophyta sp. CCMP2293]
MFLPLRWLRQCVRWWWLGGGRAFGVVQGRTGIASGYAHEPDATARCSPRIELRPQPVEPRPDALGRRRASASPPPLNAIPLLDAGEVAGAERGEEEGGEDAMERAMQEKAGEVDAFFDAFD